MGNRFCDELGNWLGAAGDLCASQPDLLSPNLLQLIASNNTPIDNTWNQILLAALNGLNARRAFFFQEKRVLWTELRCAESFTEAIACMRVGRTCIYVSLSVLPIHVLQITVCHLSAPLKSLYCCNLLSLPPFRSMSSPFAVRVRGGPTVIWEQRGRDNIVPN